MRHIDRRSFVRLSASALLAAPLLAPACSSTGERRARAVHARIARGDTLRLAIVGVANQGGSNLDEVKHEHIVALCDVDSAYLSAASARFPDARAYRDFRELLADTRLDLDGVVISTPDHTHAPAAAMALKLGIGVYLEKPLTHTVAECRRLAELARANDNVTQMGTLIHAGDNYRRVVELIQSGAIGAITQVDCWCPKSWCCGTLTPGATPPPQLDWPLWQGPVPEQPYVNGIAPANWRSYWRYGTGTLGDMGCHILDLPFWALDLAGPRGDRCMVSASGPPLDAVGCPQWLEATWTFPGARADAIVGATRAGGDPLILRWFDGGRVPPTVQELGAKDGKDYFGRFMVCFQGTNGFVLANYGELLVLQCPDAVAPPRTLAASSGHHQEWINAIKTGRATGNGSPLCRFEYAAPLTEMVLLGTVAYRAGTAFEWDRRNGVARSAHGALGASAPGSADRERAADSCIVALLSEPYRDDWQL